MTKTISILLVAAGALLAAPQTPVTPAAPHARGTFKVVKKKASPTTPPLTIPAAAVLRADGTYRYVDGSGKAWIFHQTPFGVSRMAEIENGTGRPQAAPAPVATREDHVTAVADGDVIRFEKPTPFGPTKWQKNKTELTADEQKIWDREQAKRKQ